MVGRFSLTNLFSLVVITFVTFVQKSYQKFIENDKPMLFLQSEKRCNNALECYLEAIETVQKMKIELTEMKEDLQKKFDQKEAEMIKRYEVKEKEHEDMIKLLKEQNHSDIQKYERKITSFPKRIIIKNEENLCITFVTEEGDLILKDCNDEDYNQKWMIEPYVNTHVYLKYGDLSPILWGSYMFSICNLNKYGGFSYMSEYLNPRITARRLNGKVNPIGWRLDIVNFDNFDNKYKIWSSSNGCLMKTNENKIMMSGVNQTNLCEEFLIEY